MKRYILSGMIGALCMLLLLFCIAAIRTEIATQEEKRYEHVDFVSQIPQEECFVCGSGSDSEYWGEDNVAILNLNTFEMLRLEINRYDDQGHLIEEYFGYLSKAGLYSNDTYVNSRSHPDKGYASAEITSLDYAIDRELVQSKLCQTCLNRINDLWFFDSPPAEFAFVNLMDRTIHPLISTCPWFAAGNYGVDCEFEEDGDIDLLIHYCADRYDSKGVE